MPDNSPEGAPHILISAWGDPIEHVMMTKKSPTADLARVPDRSAILERQSQPGGADLLIQLLDAVKQYFESSWLDVRAPKLSRGQDSPDKTQSFVERTFVQLARFPYATKGNQTAIQQHEDRQWWHDRMVEIYDLLTQLPLPVENESITEDQWPRLENNHISSQLKSTWIQLSDRHGRAPWRIDKFLGRSPTMPEDCDPSRFKFPTLHPKHQSQIEILNIVDHGCLVRTGETTEHYCDSHWRPCLHGEVAKNEFELANEDEESKKAHDKAAKKRLAEAKWIIYRLSAPLRTQDEKLRDLLNELLSDPTYSEKLILILSADALREAGMFISSRHSWEKVTADIHWGLRNHRTASELSKARHLIISFDSAGCVHDFSPADQWQGERSDSHDERVTTLYYDPNGLERFWLDQHPGLMVGRTYCLASAIAFSLALDAQDPRAQTSDDGETEETPGRRALLSIRKGIFAGLSSNRDMHRFGYAISDATTKDSKARAARLPRGWPVDITAASLAYHIRRLWRPKNSHPSLIQARNRDTPTVPIDGDYNRPTAYLDFNYARFENSAPYEWSILKSKGYSESLELAREIVRRGVGALEAIGAPIGVFGKLRIVERKEIEEIRTLRRLIIEYHERGAVSRPLSLAVFGPPGSGKSFAVKQIAESTNIPNVAILECNLSQYASPHELAAFFHKIRNSVLEGQLPIVIWDEFDCSVGTNSLYWLKFMLAPMQDGQFFENGVAHPLGKVVFVFSGGVFRSMADPLEAVAQAQHRDVGSDARDAEPAQDRRSATEVADEDDREESGDGGEGAPEGDGDYKSKFPTMPGAGIVAGTSSNIRSVKLPDFMSRLSGFAHIRGVDPADPWDGDHSYILRRSLLLRTFLEPFGQLRTHAGDIAINEYVLFAFLTVSRYRHGARSIEALVNTSILSNEREYFSSSLPPRMQRVLHCDSFDFGRLQVFKTFVECCEKTIDDLKDPSASDHAADALKNFGSVIDSLYGWLRASGKGYSLDSSKYEHLQTTEAFMKLPEWERLPETQQEAFITGPDASVKAQEVATEMTLFIAQCQKDDARGCSERMLDGKEITKIKELQERLGTDFVNQLATFLITIQQRMGVRVVTSHRRT